MTFTGTLYPIHPYSWHFYGDISAICWNVTGPIFLLAGVTFIKEERRLLSLAVIRIAGISLVFPLRTTVKAGYDTHKSCSEAPEKSQWSQDWRNYAPRETGNALKWTLSSLLLLLGTFANFLQVKWRTQKSHPKMEFRAIRNQSLSGQDPWEKSYRTQHSVHTVLSGHSGTPKLSTQNRTHWNPTASSHWSPT